MIVQEPPPVDAAQEFPSPVHGPHHAVVAGSHVNIRIAGRGYGNGEEICAVHVIGQTVKVNAAHSGIPQICHAHAGKHGSVHVQEIPPLGQIRAEPQPGIQVMEPCQRSLSQPIYRSLPSSSKLGATMGSHMLQMGRRS